MSSGSTIIFIPAAATSSGGGGDDDDDDVECRACYGIVVACASMLLFCILAATSGVVKACAVTGFVVVFCGVIGWLVPAGPRGGSGSAANGGDAVRAHGDAGVAVALRRAGLVGRLVGAAAAADVPPAFAYEGPSAGDSGGSSGKHGGGALCAVCLEDVRRGETVRRLPACGHLFHRDCVDMWLHSHATCPLCRCHLSPRRRAAKAMDMTPAAAAQPSSGEDALPPV